MTWFKVDDGLHAHKKAARAGVAPMGLWVLAGSWAADQLTDGFVPDYIAARIDPDFEEHAARLVSAGLWEIAEDADGDKGWQFHDWADEGRQPTAASVKQKQQEARDRMARIRAERKANRPTGSQPVRANTGQVPERDANDPLASQGVRANTSGTNDERSGEVRSAPTRPDPTRPDPTVVPTELLKEEDQNPTINAARRSWAEVEPGTDQALIPIDDIHAASVKRASRDAQFDAYWKPYPRKVGKQGARKVWDTKVKNGADPDAIAAGAVAFAEHVQAWQTPEDKIPHPSTWLNAGRWEDVLPPPPGREVAVRDDRTGTLGQTLPDGRTLHRKTADHLDHLAAYGGDPDA